MLAKPAETEPAENKADDWLIHDQEGAEAAVEAPIVPEQIDVGEIPAEKTKSTFRSLKLLLRSIH